MWRKPYRGTLLPGFMCDTVSQKVGDRETASASRWYPSPLADGRLADGTDDNR